MDHCNAGLLWSAALAARFRWVWKEATTFAAYTAETVSVLPVLCGERLLTQGMLEGFMGQDAEGAGFLERRAQGHRHRAQGA